MQRIFFCVLLACMFVSSTHSTRSPRWLVQKYFKMIQLQLVVKLYTHIWVYFWWSAFSEIERCWNWFPPFRRMIRFDVEKWLSNMTEYHRRLVHSLRNLNAKTLRRGRPENIELKLETKEERIWGNVKKTTENVSCAFECRWEERWNN